MSVEHVYEKAAAGDFSKKIKASPPCLSNVARKGFLSFAAGNCSHEFDYFNICNYDYIVIGHSKFYDYFTQRFAQKLSSNFDLVYSDNYYTVQKRRMLNQTCLPESA